MVFGIYLICCCFVFDVFDFFYLQGDGSGGSQGVSTSVSGELRDSRFRLTAVDVCRVGVLKFELL